MVAPKKEALEKTQAALAITMGELNEKKASLKVVQDDLASLQANLAGAEQKKAELLNQVDLCGKKLVRAKQLIESLGGALSVNRAHSPSRISRSSPSLRVYNGEGVLAWTLA